MNFYTISVDVIDYYYRHTFDLNTRDKKKYVDGLEDLESHGLIKKVNGSKYIYEYDLDGIYFDPTKCNKENGMYFSVVYSNELNTIMQLSDTEFSGSRAKLVRYFVNVISTFMNGKSWSFEMEDGTYKDGIVGFSSMEALAEQANISTDSVDKYNKILEKHKLLYVYRAETLKLIDNKVHGITNTYGRYIHKRYVIGEGKDHKSKYGYDKSKDNTKQMTAKTTARKSMGAKYSYLVSGQKEYDKQTIIEIYKYAVEFNRIHDGDYYYEDKLKDLNFFKQYPFITDDLLQKKTQKAVDKNIWGKPDPMDKDYSLEEIVEMATTSDIAEGCSSDSEKIDIDSIFEEEKVPMKKASGSPVVPDWEDDDFSDLY